MSTLTQYVIYEKYNDNDNKVVNIKIRYVCYGINDAENKFNTLKQIIPNNVFMDTTTNFHSKFSIQ